MGKVKIVYGTGGGNTELVCEKVSSILSKKHAVDLLQVKVTDPMTIKNFDLLIFASPTYGHGQLEQYFRKFIKKAQKMDLKDKSVAVIGLGDDKYDPDYYIESARILSEFFKEKQANIIISPLKVGRSAVPKLKGKVEKWAKDLSKLI